MIRAAGAIVFRKSKGFLLLKKKDYWEFPKGRVDADDKDLLATALREVKEETGLADIQVAPGFHEQEQYMVSQQNKTVDYWIFTTKGNPTISSEHLGFAWFSEKEVLHYLTFASKKIVFKKAAAFLKSAKLMR